MSDLLTRMTWEKNFVARLLADKKMIDQSALIDDHLQDATWWSDQKLYHLYMFLLFFRFEGEQDGWWKKMKELGMELNKKPEKKMEDNNALH